MIDFKLNRDTHDLVIDRFEFALISGIDQIAQHIKQRLWLFRGEWFLDTEAGMPWMQDVFIKSPRRYIVEQAIKATIVETPGVNELIAFSMGEPDANRSVRVEFTVGTDLGSQTIEVVI